MRSQCRSSTHQEWNVKSRIVEGLKRGEKQPGKSALGRQYGDTVVQEFDREEGIES